MVVHQLRNILTLRTSSVLLWQRRCFRRRIYFIVIFKDTAPEDETTQRMEMRQEDDGVDHLGQGPAIRAF
ncbi:unnamed protein product, partial [Nesidiocoris tenuis]